MHETIRTHEHLLGAFQRAEEVYDPVMANHSQRVAKLAVSIGRTLGLSESDLTVLSWVGNLHDIGKLGVAQAIVQKRGVLTKDEWIEVRQHPLIGEAIIVAISPTLELIARSVRGHHERFDGLGYPDGLVGEEIPLMARFVSIADSYDALTHILPYRSKIFTPQDALNTIVAGAGEQYDPALVEAFERMHPRILTERKDGSRTLRSAIARITHRKAG